ncbi:hypothetical protein Ais01nite_75950 [Asanoa ishikariensis]|uniref:Uncharacterized protein n=1 Tax=Asanoa ishikariensis TaxID=137265 RepID=A0A1H3L1H8_9ACTN|nr:hypothetical protein [Asanoa ishikariensis]GIF69560.1 hypothetical protein Ais01nite_75950 [Asanoa ishikariensis]SDY58251.1 hypothetical protein SAMN05421684_0475 [Asanoa ishikariensis]
MEIAEAREQLRAVERASAAPYVQYPPSPWWYAPAVGAWVAGIVATFVWWRVNAALFLAALGVLIALELVFVFWARRRHGALPFPGRGRPPSEIAAVWRRYLIGALAIVSSVALTWWLTGPLVAAGVAFVLVTGGIAAYERRYARAATEVRSRLS